MSDKLLAATCELFEKLLGAPLELDTRLAFYDFDQQIITSAQAQKKVVIKGLRRINWQRMYGLYIPTYSNNSLYEIAIQDYAPDGTWHREKLRYSESYAIEEFLKKYAEQRIGGIGNEEYYAILGDLRRIKELTQLVMEENYKNGRSI